MIHYDIDTTENGYGKLDGDAENVNELRQVLMKDDRVPNMKGYLSLDEMPDVYVCIASENELGFFISISDDDDIKLTLGNSATLSDTIDLWGDGIYVSKGLFIPLDDAWDALEEYLNTGNFLIR